jgi:PhzF family phenazine biosynthesis protein
MRIQRISAFSMNDAGGNPAGVVIADQMPEPADMARIAAEVGYSETAFAAPQDEGWRVRYFSPASEVPFCGHATIALGAALGAREGAGRFSLKLNSAAITVEAGLTDGYWQATLSSPPTSHQVPDAELVSEAMRVFGIKPEDLDAEWPITRATAGADMLIIPLARRERLAVLRYNLAEGAALQNAHDLVGMYFIVADGERQFDARMAFASGGVLEDPATGAAAAAFSGWLRDSGRISGGVSVRQGDDMGMPSRISCVSSGEIGSPIRVSGATRRLD